jgi:hypothetical protein
VLDPLGNIFNQILVPEGAPEGSANPYFQFPNGFTLLGNPAARPFILLEADGSISDMVGVLGSNGFVGFLSDTEAPLNIIDENQFLNAGLSQVLFESSVPLDVTALVNPGFLPPGFTVQFASDVEATPLPPAWTFMLLGLVVFGFAAARRTRTGTVALAAA